MGHEFYRHNQVKFEAPFLFPPVGHSRQVKDLNLVKNGESLV